jgi:hypothetical protein
VCKQRKDSEVLRAYEKNMEMGSRVMKRKKPDIATVNRIIRLNKVIWR